MNQELLLAEQYINDTGTNIYLTGKAGTGKTTFLHKLKHNCPKRMVVTAPTGVAAINAQGVTLHSFFQLPFGPYVPGSSRTDSFFKFSKEKSNIIRSLDLLIIDEISMVRGDVLDGVEYTLRRLRQNQKPFGGVQLLMIGDLFQLPPVINETDWKILREYYTSPYFFSSIGLQKTKLLTIELKKVYRQEDEHFIELLNKVRNGKVDESARSLLESRFKPGFEKESGEEYITLCTHNAKADQINNEALDSLSTPVFTSHATVEGEFPDHSFPAADELPLKKGAQVMFIRNDPSADKEYYNGKIGKIVKIDDEELVVRGKDDQLDIVVEKVTWENIEYYLNPETENIEEIKKGEFKQLPLRLAWAITIHKSQGLTFDRAIIDGQQAFAHGQIYVALSRCRSLEGLVLTTPLGFNTISVDKSITSFLSLQLKNKPADEHLYQAKITYEQDLIRECFDFRKLHTLLNKFYRLLQQNYLIIQLSGSFDIDEIKRNAEESIIRVGGNFINQLNALFSSSTQPSRDDVINERLYKAADYYDKQFGSGFVEQLQQFHFDTDNSEVRKQIKRSHKLLLEESVCKQSAVASCRDGFSAITYFRALSKASLKKPSGRKTKTSVTYSEKDIAHPEFFNRLKEWRMEKAMEENVAHFQVMHQKCLVQIASNLPTNTDALLQLKGIGPKLAERYGDELIGMTQRFCQENGIEKTIEPIPSVQPEEKQEKRKSHLISLELFNKGEEIKAIAERRNLAISTIERHLTLSIKNGELSVDKLVSPECCTEIITKNTELNNPGYKELRHELQDKYSYSVISFCLAHQKFIQEDE